MPTPLPPVDPDVKLPPSIAAQGAAADELHARAYPKQADPQPDPTPSPAADTLHAEPPAPQPAPPPAQSAEPPAPLAPQPGDPYPDKQANLTPEQWRHQYLSMKGRYEQAAQSIGTMQEQIQELGDELMRWQHRTQQQPQQPTQPVQPTQRLITDDEVNTYGPELVDMIQRAAREAILPELQQTHNSLKQVNQRVQQVSTGNLYADLDRAISDWRTINISPRFKQWCSLRDVYSGVIRGKMLNAAFQAADAPRVVAFFQGFLNEEQATGQYSDPSGQPQPVAAARVPAIPLSSLTAPGRAHPAGGNDLPSPVDKPIFTRSQIAAFYREVREGRYVGRDQDKNSAEQAIFMAQREGRVR